MKIHECDQNTEVWDGYRAGIPTASNFKKLITSTGDPSKSMTEYALQLAGEAFAGRSLDSWDGNQWTARGHEIEPEARDYYQFLTGTEVTQVGFVTDDCMNYGASPDGMVGIDGLNEIKCLSAKEHTKVLLYYKKHKKTPPDYIAQTQGQILVCEREWCDLLYYHPHLPKLVLRQHRDETLQSALTTQIHNCIEERDRILSILKEF